MKKTPDEPNLLMRALEHGKEEALARLNADPRFGYAPDCADCPTPEACKAANDCAVMRSIRHPRPSR